MNILSTAQRWVSAGYSVIPIRFMSKKPALPTWEPYMTRRPTGDELKVWFRSQLTNIALITGNGLLVIDFDVQAVFDYWFAQAKISTYMVKTRRGVHVYVKTHQQERNYHSELLDIKAERGYVLIPPSTHPSGYEYQVLSDAPIMEVETLADVLPVTYMPAPEPVRVTPTPNAKALDPWDAAMSPLSTEERAETISKIRETISMTRYLPDAQPTSRDGRWLVALCPFHDDHAPSMWIDTRRKICGCRRCNIKAMDVINLHARLNGISNQQAIRELAQQVTA